MTHKNHSSWIIVDAAGKRVGRLASRVAHMLQGKHLVSYAPHERPQCRIIIVNAQKVVFTGKKFQQKEYIHHSGYLGGIKRRQAAHVLRETPERILEYAIKGMLPKNRLASRMMNNVRIYKGDTHPHQAQQPTAKTLI